MTKIIKNNVLRCDNEMIAIEIRWDISVIDTIQQKQRICEKIFLKKTLLTAEAVEDGSPKFNSKSLSFFFVC